MANNDFLVFGAPAIGEEEIFEVERCIRSGWLGTGPRVQQFENQFAEYKKIKNENVLALNSCTAALHIAMLTANLPENSEVITTPLTFCATVNTIIHAGLIPKLVDVDPITFNIDISKIEEAITHKTKAILVVHFAGRACDMGAIRKIAKKHNLVVFEDCAHAIETTYKGELAGTMGDYGCFSFYSTKNVVTGEGGMILAKDSKKIRLAKVLSLHGMSKDAWKRFSTDGYKHYDVIAAGFKYNMMDIQAALGIHQLARVETNWKRRKEIWELYMKELATENIMLPAPEEENSRHAYHLFTVLIDKDKCGLTRDEFLDQMTSCHIGVGVHYMSIPEHSYYQEHFGWKPQDYPNAMKIGRQTVSLPLSAKMTYDDTIRVISNIKKILNSTDKK